MADEKTPQFIQYIIDAAVQNQRGINELVDNLAKIAREGRSAQKVLADLQAQVNKGLGVKSPQQARQAGAILGALAQGDLGTRFANAQGRRALAEINASPEMQVEKTTRALEKQHQTRMRLIEKELAAYERMARIAEQVLNTSNVARSGAGRARRLLEEYINPLLVSESGRSLSGAARNSRAQSIINQMATGQFDPAPLVGRGVDWIGLSKGEFRDVLASVREMRQETERKRQQEERITAELREQKRLQDAMRTQTAQDKSIRRNFMRENAGRMRAMPSDMVDDYFQTQVAGVRPFLSQGGFVALQQEVADLRRREADRETRRAVQQDRDWNEMMRRAEIENRAFDLRKRREAEAPQRQAIMANQRADAFGGAGLFSIQGKLLANYATWGAGLGSLAFLGNYTVQYEKALKQLQAISTATAGEMRDLDNAIVSVAKNSIFSAQEIADAATLMAQAGLTVKQIEVALPAVKNLAVATGTDLATSMDAVTSTMTIFDLQTSEMERVANTLTAAMNMSKLTIDKFSLGLQYSGNIAETVGIRYNELASLLGGMTDAGIRSGSTLGTGLRQLLLDLQSPSDKAKEVFKRVGLSSEELDVESQGIFRVLKNLKEASLTTADATEAFEVRAVAAFKALMNQLPEIEQLNESIMLTEAATAGAGVQMDSLAAKWTQFSTGAGAAFYKTTELTREALKKLLDVFIWLFGAIEPLSGVLNIATLAAVTFMAVWSVAKVVAIVKGLGEMRAAMMGAAAATTGAAGAMGALRLATAAVGGPLVMITGIITTAVTMFGLLGGATSDYTEAVERSREATNRAKGDFEETSQVIESLDTAAKKLTDRYGVFTEGGEDLKSEILSLNTAFSEHGLVLDENADSIDTVIAKTSKLRAELSQLAAVQAQVAYDAAHNELTMTVNKSLSDLNQGNFADGSKAPTFNMSRFMSLTNNNPEMMDFYRFIIGGVNSQGQPWFNPTGLETLDLTEIFGMRAKIGRTQQSLLRERENGSSRSRFEIDADLAEIEKAQKWINEIFLVASRIRAQNLNIKNLSNSAAEARGTSSEFFFDEFQRYVEISKGQIGNDLTDLLGREDLGADRIQEEVNNLREKWKINIKGVEVATAGLLKRWVDEGVVKNLEEAKELLGSSPVGDDVNWIANVLSREFAKLDPEVNKLFAELLSDRVAANAAQMRAMVEGSRLQTMKLPAGSVPAGASFSGQISGTFDAPVWNRLPLPELVAKMEANQKETEELARQQFGRANPNAFALDPAGRYKNPALADQYFAEAAKRQAEFEKNLETVYRNYGKDFLSPDEKNKRNKDAEIELLKTRIAATRRKMQEIRGSVDGQSAADAVWQAQEEYAAAFELLKELELELEGRVWDASPWKDTALADQIRQGNLDALKSGLDATEGKTLSDLTNLGFDIEGGDKSRVAKARRQALEAQLEAEMSNTSSLTSLAAAEARVEVANALIGSIVDEFTAEFWNNPENREKQHVPEKIAEFTQLLLEKIALRTQNVIAVANAMVEERGFRAEARIRQLQAEAASFDNMFNAGRVGSTERWMQDQKIGFEQLKAQGSNINAMIGRQSMLEDEKKRLTLGVALSRPGSESSIALRRELNSVEQQLVQTTRELEQATLEYAAALGAATDPKWNELFRATVQLWAEGEGVLLSWAQTLADGLPQIFSNANSQISQALGDIISHSRDTGDAVEDMARSIFRSLIDMSIKIMTNKLIQMAFSWFTGGQSGAPGTDVSQLAYPGQFDTYSSGAGFSQGGEVHGAIQNRDSVRAMLMPGEVVMRKTAVDMIGKENLLRMNRTGQMATQMSAMVMEQKREPDMVNVYVVQPGQKPSMGPRDVVVAIADDIMKDGQTKKLIKAVAVGALG